MNRYAFTGEAANVTVRHLTVLGFVPPVNEGVVNHDSGPAGRSSTARSRETTALA